MYRPFPFPPISRNAPDILGIRPDPYLSLDWEWNIRTEEPTILGVSDGVRTVSVPHYDGKGYLMELLSKCGPNVRYLGHNLISADMGVAEKEGIRIPLEQVDDSIIWHWLTNSSICKGTKKSDDEEGERRGRGFMNLYAFCSTYLGVSNWKECIGEEQCLAESRPCPEHRPFDYNGDDCYYPVHAIKPCKVRGELLGTSRLYPLHRDLVHALSKMRDRGVFVDVEHVNKIRTGFEGQCRDIAKILPFNPNSPVQVKRYFAGKGITLENAQQATLEEAFESNPDDEELDLLVTYGQLGNGPDRWFAPLKWNYEKNKWEGYVDETGYIHPNLQIFTSTGRLACSRPNLQNISHRPKKFEKGMDPKDTIQGRIRRSIVAPEGYYLAEADFSNAENRVMLHLAGHSVPGGVDLHTWVSEIAEFKPEDPFCLKEGSPRQAAKTVQHGNFYGEGLQLLSREEFRKPRIQAEIAKGLRIAYPDWTFEGQIVTFTGINFARRAFGTASWENRVKANGIIGKLFGRFPGVRDLQRKISNMVERERCVRNDFGYVLASYGYPGERIKSALAFTGSNPVAHATKLAILNAVAHPKLDVRLQIHDSLLFYFPLSVDPAKAKGYIKEAMEIRLEEMGGLVIPVDVKCGKTWVGGRKV